MQKINRSISFHNMSSRQDIQDFFRAQGSSREFANGFGFDFSDAKGSCSAFAVGSSVDTHMTRIYSCRPLSAQTNFMEEASNVFGAGS
jgi:hypothetical protein